MILFHISRTTSIESCGHTWHVTPSCLASCMAHHCSCNSGAVHATDSRACRTLELLRLCVRERCTMLSETEDCATPQVAQSYASRPRAGLRVHAWHACHSAPPGCT